MPEDFQQVDVVNELNVDADDFITKTAQWKTEEQERASDAGVTRQDIGRYLEKTNLNSKALAHVRGGMKLKKEADRKDWLRSMKELLPIAEDSIMGQSPQTEMPIDTPPEPVE